jgi:sulfate-transporting ATPase
VTLAIVTLALSLVFSAIVFQNASLTGGFSGIKVRSPEIFGLDLDPFEYPQRYAALMLLALTGVAFLVANLRRGATGRRMVAVRSNERAAAALGISVIGVKLYAFAVGAGIAALGGILLTFRQTNVQFGGFDVFGSILLVQYAVIGGLGWISGVVLGAGAAPGAISTRITNDLFPNLDNVAAWIAILSAVGVVQLLRRAPDGVASLWASAGRKVPLLSRRRPVPAAVVLPASDASPLTPSELEIRGVSVSFGGVKAVDDVSFNVSPGEVIGLIGPNGAGKTTLLDVISGFTRQQSGRVLLDGTDVSAWSPERRARAGIVRSWQGVELFEELTVRDNLLVADDRASTVRYARDLVWPGRSSLSPYAESVVDDLGLRAVLDERPTTLSHGLIKLVGIARTIVSNPRIVLLDEPAAGLDRDESRELTNVIRRFTARHGVAVVIIEHDMALILNTCDRIVALDFGKKIADAAPQDVQTDELVIRPSRTRRNARAWSWTRRERPRRSQGPGRGLREGRDRPRRRPRDP